MDRLFYLLLSGGFLAVAAQTCEPIHYERCLIDLRKFTHRDSLIFAQTGEQLDAECVKAQRHLDCVKNYVRKCIGPDDRGNYTRDIAESDSLMSGICRDEADLKRRFLGIVPCLRNASEDVIYCKEKYDRNNRDISIMEYEDKIQLQCCSFYGYEQCLRRLMSLQTECGEDVAEVVDEIVVRLKGDFVHETCSELYERCKGAANGTPGIHILTLLTSFLLVVFCKRF